MPPVSDHFPKADHNRGWQNDHKKKQDEVCDRRWILKRMRSVRVEKSATICAKMLDGFEGRDRANRNCLLGSFKRMGRDLGVQRLR